MKRQIITILTLAMVVFLIACNPEDGSGDEARTASISGTIEDTIRQDVTLWRIQSIGDDERIAVDSSERESFNLSVDIDDPGAYFLRYGRSSIMVFLHPGDELVLESSAEDFSGTALFSGTGADANNYLADGDRKVKVFMETQEEQNPYKLNEETFLKTMNELREIRTALYEKRFAEGAPSLQFENFAKAQINGGWASQISNYPTYHEYYTGVEDFEVSDAYPDESDVVAINNADALISPNYRSYLYGRSQRMLSDLATSDTTLSNNWPKVFSMHYDNLKADDQLGDGTREYLLATVLNDFISIFGVDGVDDIWNDYKSNHADSEFIASIRESYDSWAKLAKGMPAPGFNYTSIKGETVSLSDFKGKVVYVDVWATWCGPCKREIPASKELKKKMEGEDVVFLYVSVDENQESWEKFLEDDPEFKGVHLITGTGWKSDITEDYMIDGIPRYLLIDRQGNIASASAPRPSSGEEIENLIYETLGTEDIPAGD